MKRCPPWTLVLRVACLLLLLPNLAQAHLMPPGQATVRIVGDSAYALVAVPVSTLTSFDDDGDKRLSLRELNTHRDDLRRQVNEGLQFRNGEDLPELVFDDLLLSHTEQPGTEGAEHVVAMRRYQWTKPVETLHVKVGLFDKELSSGAQLSIRALRGDDAEVGIVSRHQREHAFFAGSWATAKSYLALGVEHILLGADHLLFLLTVLIAGAGWRYWVTMTGVFTVAHSITLSLAAFGLVRAPASIVEPLIAASIILVTVHTLWRGVHAARQRLGLVFACGLLHGMGIASVLSDIGMSEDKRVLSLFAFNIGVELGQLTFAAVMLALLGLGRRLLPDRWRTTSMRLYSLAAVIIAAGWLAERTFS